MFGNKGEKRERLQRLVGLIRAQDGITQAELARHLGVPRATVHKDLAALEEAGILLAENDGRLSYFGIRQNHVKEI